jgi:hypothetical protein
LGVRLCVEHVHRGAGEFRFPGGEGTALPVADFEEVVGAYGGNGLQHPVRADAGDELRFSATVSRTLSPIITVVGSRCSNVPDMTPFELWASAVEAARLFCLLALEISAGKRGEAQRSGRGVLPATRQGSG